MGESEVRFRFPDPDRRLAGVRLQQRVGLRDTDLRYDEADRAWVLLVPTPAAWRIEYQFELHHRDGGVETVDDPGNPMRVAGAFGDKSVWRSPAYAPPAWLEAPVAAGTWRDLAGTRIWSAAGAEGLVLLAHDGPEYDRLGSLGRFCAAMVAAGRLPSHHLVLLAPGERNEQYSANPRYAQALVGEVLPAITRELGGVRSVVGLGVSLGALAMLHAHRHDPGVFGGLFLQSGSFFLPRLDPQERGFAWYPRIVRFVGSVLRAPEPRPLAVLTCGSVEENLANNRRMARALEAPLAEVPDGHNYTAWRDSLDPHLVGLLEKVWGDA
jgi:enterochelin esterase family protein